MCPGGEDPCSSHGQCDANTGLCSCEIGRHGSDCSSESVMYPYIKINIFLIISFLLEFNCPGDGSCSNQGTCDSSSGTCICDSGFEGHSCQGRYHCYVYEGLRLSFLIS